MKKQAKQRIKKNMLTLLETYPLDQITIKMICAYSDVNRTTFYDHFQDKFDLMYSLHEPHLRRYNAILESVQNHLQDYLQEPERLIQLFRIYFKYLQKHQNFYRAIIVTFPQRDLVESYILTTRDIYRRILQRYDKLQSPQHFIQYTIGGQLGIIYFWLRNDCETPPEAMAQVLYTNLVRTQR